jgi:acyl-CoA reductase-like NAD-dependent aldehyde dehydrogenase
VCERRLADVPTCIPRQVILKPAESTPLTAFAMAELARRAGFPAGTLNMLTGDPAKISAFCA